MVLTVAFGLTGCGDARSPSTPTAPPPAGQPSDPQPGRVQPTVTAVTPRVGSTQGGTWATITGAGFQSGATVTMGEVRISASVLDGETIAILTPAHAAGAVDVSVVNPGGLQNKLAGGYAFASPETFDFNGDWLAHVGPDFEMAMRFTIRNNVLVSLSCNMSPPVALESTLSVGSGGFSFQSDDGLKMTGTLVSPVGAAGTIDMPDVPGCRAARWWADKQ